MSKVPDLRNHEHRLARHLSPVNEQRKENLEQQMMIEQDGQGLPAAHQQQATVASFGQPMAAHQQHQQASQQQHQEPLEHYLMRHSRNQQLLALEHLRAMSSCSNESSTACSSNGRNSSIGDHSANCFLEPFELHDSTMSSNSSLSGLYTRLARRVRLLESPCDSGFDSGKENGSYSALGFARTSHLASQHSCHLRSTTPIDSSSSSSTCMSPINELLYHRARANSAASRIQLSQHRPTCHAAHTRQLDLNQLSREQQQQLALARNLTMAGRPASALGGAHASSLVASQHPRPRSQNQDHHQSALVHASNQCQQQQQQQQQSGSIDDMPMLKRALQAPPLINTNMLMDEAYRHHKKFRAAQRREQVGGAETPTVGSTSGSRGSAAVSRAISPASQARSPSPPHHQDCLADSGKLSNGAAGTGSSSSSSLSLATMHSTLLSKLNQPSNLQLSKQQLKCNDLIHEMILRDSPPATGALKSETSTGASTSPIPNGTVAPASSPVSTSSSHSTSSITSNNNSNDHNTNDISERQIDIRSNLQRILISGQQKLGSSAKLGAVDEDYIAKRLLCVTNTGSNQFRHHRHNFSATEQQASNQQRPSAHHRPSSSCASSSSPSPTSSLSTGSPSPSSSVSPDLGMVLSTPSSGRSSSTAHASHLHHHRQPSASVEMDALEPNSSLPSSQQVSQLTSSYQYIDQHLSYHRQQQPTQIGSNLNVNLPMTISCSLPQVIGQRANMSNSLLVARSPVSPMSSCDAHSNLAHYNSASPSPSSPRISGSQLSNQLSHISKLSLNCNAGAQVNHQQTTTSSTFGLGNKLNLLQVASNVTSVNCEGGNFGLLADVAVAAAEEQSRIEQQQQAEAAAAAAASAQPIDLSKK